MRPSGWTVALIQWSSQSSSSVRLAMSASSVWWAASSVIVRCDCQTPPTSAVACTISSESGVPPLRGPLLTTATVGWSAAASSARMAP